MWGEDKVFTLTLKFWLENLDFITELHFCFLFFVTIRLFIQEFWLFFLNFPLFPQNLDSVCILLNLSVWLTQLRLRLKTCFLPLLKQEHRVFSCSHRKSKTSSSFSVTWARGRAAASSSSNQLCPDTSLCTWETARSWRFIYSASGLSAPKSVRVFPPDLGASPLHFLSVITEPRGAEGAQRHQTVVQRPRHAALFGWGEKGETDSGQTTLRPSRDVN